MNIPYFVICCLLCAVVGTAQEVSRNTYRIRIGTLEQTPDVERLYVFKHGAEVESWDYSPGAFLKRAGIDFGHMPDLLDIGFKTKNGEFVKYSGNKYTFIKQWFKDHPEAKVESMVFEGAFGEYLEIKIKGLNSVCRVDVSEKDRLDFTLWKNLPGQTIPQAPRSPASPYKIRIGTLQLTSDVKGSFVFSHGSKKEIFDPSGTTSNLLEKAPSFLPGLSEVGFNTGDGKFIQYTDPVSRDAFLTRWVKDHPGVKIESFVFSGLLAEELKVKTTGPTPVCRVDLGRKGILWKNLPPEVVPDLSK